MYQHQLIKTEDNITNKTIKKYVLETFGYILIYFLTFIVTLENIFCQMELKDISLR